MRHCGQQMAHFSHVTMWFVISDNFPSRGQLGHSC